MKDVSREFIEDTIPNDPALDLIKITLEKFYQDKTHLFQGYCADHLTFEEVMGALLKARHELESYVADEESDD
ncbi:MAG: hypothetical protein ACSHX0_14040 [Akkermansiaceae bacterium]